jgi:spermidine synthase
MTDFDRTGAAPAWWRERSDGLGVAQSLEITRLHREESPFQVIEIFEHEAFGRILVLDGYVQASQADEFIYHEMALHVPLLGRERRDASVLIVGGGDGGALRSSAAATAAPCARPWSTTSSPGSPWSRSTAG